MLDNYKLKKGFTIIELIVVIAVIAVLGTIVMVSVNGYIAKGRDARRKNDLSNIARALVVYYEKVGNYIESGSGCGYNGTGVGWFNYGPTAQYPKSIMQCLIDAGAVGSEIIDPTGGRTSSPSSGYSYMKYTCGNPVRTYIYAKLQTLPQSSTATDGTCCANCDSSYGMNYYIKL